ncbi:hypothetical protein M0805_008864 [Coniferiporia weirii]|nr:hypothetical protein M0805_008864 [Coniferiporia weirii]
MARGAHSPTPAIPKVSFTKVEDDASTQPAGVHDQQARSYGFNDFSSFQRPEHYLRYIEPLDNELALQVEYDMDEQDQEWLDAVNNERRNEQLNKVSYEAFEIIMDRLEKEWFDLTKNIPKPDMALPSEDSTCAICDDAEGENSNAIVFCDGCNLAVHQDCYGVPYIPEGQWLCRKCTVSPENPVSCKLCPNEGGAFKQTISGDWAHLLCAIWVPETRVANDVFMEPITGVDRINKQRWKLKCSLCGIREGACIQCSKTSCFLAFHTTCARREKLLMPMKSAHGTEPATLTCYCEKHLPKEQLAIHEAALAELDEAPQESGFDFSNASLVDVHTPRSSKKARAYAKTYKLGAPLVPAIIVRNLIQYIARINIRKKLDFVHLVCRYWSLKREARRGAPLLKRLHLEPWTASAAGKAQTEEEIAIKLEYLKCLREDLESVRMLAELTRKREMQKQKQAQVIHEVISTVFFPHAPQLRNAFERIEALDRNEFFKNPVSRTVVPDYFDVIKKPMCWKTIDTKLDANKYWNVKDFQDDVNLVLDNAVIYNKPDTPIYRAAMKIKASSAHILDEVRQLARHIPSDSPEAGLVGDLEPPLSVLDLLTSIDAIDADTPFILDKDPLESIFAFELEQLKPPPPPKPPKAKRDRRAEAERRRQRMLDQAAGFRAQVVPRTRRAQAKIEAFEAEARGESSKAESILTDADADADGEGEGEGDEEGSMDGKISKPGRRGRRAPTVLPGQADEPPVVDDVDTQRSFSMFDAGWILSSSTRRGGRAPIEKHELPPPRKKSKTDRERQRSTLSYSTPAAENLTLRGTSPRQDNQASAQQSEEQPPMLHKREKSETVDLSDPSLLNAQPETAHDDLMDVVASAAAENVETEAVLAPEPEIGPETEPVKAGPPPKSKRRKLAPVPREVIEELDTPATRRDKNLARRRRLQEERERERQETMNAIAMLPLVEPQTQGANGEERSELSSLSALSDVEDGGEDEGVGDHEQDEDQGVSVDPGSSSGMPKEPGRRPDGRMVIAAEDARDAARDAELGPATLLVKEGEVLEGGTLVWAKADTYPWWPAVVYEEDDPDVPPSVLREKGRAPRGGGGSLLLVQFWDSKKTWQWVTLDKLRLLNEDKAWDSMMLNGSPKYQRFKTGKMKELCRAAWREAMSEMETSNVGSEDMTSELDQGRTTSVDHGHTESAMDVDAGEAMVPKVENQIY